MLCHLVAIWKIYRARYPRAKKLPLILPLVVHHSRKGWTAPVAFEAMLNVDPELLDTVRPHVPCFALLLDDLARQSDAALRARSKMTPGGRLAILSLKHGRASIVDRMRVVWPDGRPAAAGDVFPIILRYILETSRKDPAKVRALLVQRLGRKQAEALMTTAEMLRREGRKEGVTEGKREALLLQLRQRFGHLPAAARVRVEQADAATLNTWFGRVLTAESLDKVLEAQGRVRSNAS
jgi:hypothetical protein